MRQALAYIAAGIAAVLTAYALQNYATHSLANIPQLTQVLTGFVFFAVLALLGGFRADKDEDRFIPQAPAGKTPEEIPNQMARIFAGVTDDASRRRAIRGWLLTVPKVTALIPLIFFLRFGSVGPLGWGLTVFFDVYCLLWALGLFFLPRTEYHTKVELRGDWLDHAAAFWLIACALGPFFGWVATEVIPVTPSMWRWAYGVRIFFAAVIPLLLALPMLRYTRGKSASVSIPLLIAITLLPVLTAVEVTQDMIAGPVIRRQNITGKPELFLEHSERSLNAAGDETK